MRIFDHTLKELHVRPGEAIMVGNSLDSDIIGARDAGMMTIHIDHDGVNSDIPEYVIDSVSRVEKALLSLLE